MAGLHCDLATATAKMAGRLTLNPIKHIDPVGTMTGSRLAACNGWFPVWLGETSTCQFRQSGTSKTRYDLCGAGRSWGESGDGFYLGAG